MSDSNIEGAVVEDAEVAVTPEPPRAPQPPVPAPRAPETPSQSGLDKGGEMVYNEAQIDALLGLLAKRASAVSAEEQSPEPTIESLTGERDALQARIAELELQQQQQVWTAEALAKHNLPAGAARFLAGGTAEEVEAAAEALKTLLGPSGSVHTGIGGVRESGSELGDASISPAKLAEQIRAGSGMY